MAESPRMTKRLSPERIAEDLHDVEVVLPGIAASLKGHIEAIEAELRDRDTLLRNENENYRRVNQELEEAKEELTALRSWNDNSSLECSKHEQARVNAELELAEAKAEIARLKEILENAGYSFYLSQWLPP